MDFPFELNYINSLLAILQFSLGLTGKMQAFVNIDKVKLNIVEIEERLKSNLRERLNYLLTLQFDYGPTRINGMENDHPDLIYEFIERSLIQHRQYQRIRLWKNLITVMNKILFYISLLAILILLTGSIPVFEKHIFGLSIFLIGLEVLIIAIVFNLKEMIEKVEI